MASLPPEILSRLGDVAEIEIETTRKSGATRRTIIWIVVDGNDVFIRSEYGDRGWWYRDVTARPSAIVHPRDGGSGTIPVRAIPATDDESIRRCSEAIARKYRRSSAVRIMTTPPAVDATLRLEPA